MIEYKIVEKKNPLAVHSYFHCLQRAQHWLIVNNSFFILCSPFNDNGKVVHSVYKL